MLCDRPSMNSPTSRRKPAVNTDQNYHGVIPGNISLFHVNFSTAVLQPASASEPPRQAGAVARGADPLFLFALSRRIGTREGQSMLNNILSCQLHTVLTIPLPLPPPSFPTHPTLFASRVRSRTLCLTASLRWRSRVGPFEACNCLRLAKVHITSYHLQYLYVDFMYVQYEP
jgi:hypothetical protein